MKKSILFVLVFISSLAFSQEIEFEDFVLRENCSFSLWDISVDSSHQLIVTRDMNPFYLKADFNGEGKADIALSVRDKKTNKRGILIVHAEDKKSFLLGCGEDSFGRGNMDFEWLEVWHICYDKVVCETIFSRETFDIVGSKEIQIKYQAIAVAQSESPSNIIVWNGQKYIWIHTGD